MTAKPTIKTTYDTRPDNLIGSSILNTPLDHYPDSLDVFFTIDTQVHQELSKLKTLPSYVLTSADNILSLHDITIPDIALYLSYPIPTTAYTLEFILYKRRNHDSIQYGFDVDSLHSLVASRSAFDTTIPPTLLHGLCSNYIEPRLLSAQTHWEATLDKTAYTK